VRNKVDKEHILSLTDGKDYGLISPPMDAQVAVYELCRYFLGEEWYTSNPGSQRQCNTDIVYAIESNYKGFKVKVRHIRPSKLQKLFERLVRK